MRHEIAYRQLARHPRIVHHEIGKIFRDLVIPRELFLVNENCKRGACERLRIRGDRENRVLVNGLGRPELSDAVTFCRCDLPLLDDRDRHSRSAVGGYYGIGIGVDLSQFFIESLRKNDKLEEKCEYKKADSLYHRAVFWVSSFKFLVSSFSFLARVQETPETKNQKPKTKNQKP